MDAFEPTPAVWTKTAIHALNFSCPRCKASAKEAVKVWINRRAPVYTEEARRKWQEFYLCQCEQAWWSWSSDRPPTELNQRDWPSLS
jgi:hypothetical protein